MDEPIRPSRGSCGKKKKTVALVDEIGKARAAFLGLVDGAETVGEARLACQYWLGCHIAIAVDILTCHAV